MPNEQFLAISSYILMRIFTNDVSFLLDQNT